MSQPRGKRYNLRQTDACREKIQTSQIINRLHNHLVGEIEMTATQVQAAKILLDRTLPVLQSQEIKGEVANYVARLPQPAKTAEDWMASVKAREGRTATEDLAKSPSKAKH